MSSRTVLRRRPSHTARTQAMAGLLFALPMIVLFVIFRFVPTLGAVAMSFTSYKLSGDYEVVGLKNYATLAESEIFRNSLLTTLLYAVIYVPLMVVVSLALAVLLNRIVWGSGLFRGMLFLPYVTSFVLAGIIWIWLFAATGPLNKVITAVGGEPVAFLSGSQPQVLTSLAVVSVWRGFGYSMLILLAGIKTIPEELHEAARIDGAGAWQRFWRVTLPLLRPSVFFVLVIETIAAFQVFDTIYVMTGGGPARASQSLVVYLYETGFRFLDFGKAAAIGMILFLLVLVISLGQRLLLDRSDS